MAAHPKYRTIKFLIEAGQIGTIAEIFKIVPKTAVLKDFRVNFGRFNAALTDPSRFRLAELKALADLFDVDARLLVDMAYNQMAKPRRGRRKKSSTNR